MTDYSQWEVIRNGDSPIPTRVVNGVVQPTAPTTVEQRLVKKNELKARGTLLMAFPDKHQLKFIIHKDAKSLMEAIDKRFDGNKETKKRNKADLEDQSLDDLFNNLKIYEAEVKSSSSTSHSTQNISFVSSQNNDSTNESVSVVASVSVASTKPSACILPNVDNLSDVVIYSFFASQSNSPQLDNDDLKQIDANDLEEMDLKWQMAMLTMRARSYDWSFQADEEPTNYALMAFTSSSSTSSLSSDIEMFNNAVFDCDELNSYESDVSVPTSLVYDMYKSSEWYHAVPPPNTRTFMSPKPDLVFYDAPTVSLLPLSLKTGFFDSEDEFVGEPMPTQNAPSFVQTSEHVKTLRTSVKLVKHPTQAENLRKDIPKSRVHRYSWNRKACFVCKSVNHLIKDCDYYEKKMVQKNGNLHQALKDKGAIDSGCSRHMIGNISYLSDFDEINGGYVAFGGNSKGGKITSKGKIKTGKLDFDDVYFVKELMFNLFSVLQMYDKKNSFCFTDTECIVLSFDFKLPDENHVLLRVFRENNMYNVDLKNIVPSGDMTFLFAKAKLDESNLWHRSLGQVNFKTMNKLVKGNLVRLPSKVFENNHTCVACKKGKQHKASCKTKPVSSVSQPLQRVLVTKPHNKTPYELLLSRTPSIGFMRPFGCLITILNTLDPIGKFDGKADEGFLVGYSVSSKAFRVFNSKVGKEIVSTQQYVLLPLWSTGSKDPQNTYADAAFADKENKSEVHVYSSSSDKTKKHDEKAKIEAKGKSHEKGIDYEEVIAPIARIKAIWLFLTYAFFMGFMKKDNGIFISQDKYVAEILRKFGLTDGKSASTPTDTKKPLLKDPDGEGVDVHIYRSMIGSLMYLTSSRQNIMFVVCGCARFQVTPKVPHLHTVKRIFKYLKGKPHLGLWYPKDSPFNLVAYSDSDYAGASLDRKSTTGGCQFLEDTIRQALRLDNADGVDCLPNEEILLRVDTPLFDGMLVQQQVQADVVKDVVEDEDDDNKVESSADTVIDDKEDASKQGEIAKLDADEDVTLVDAEENVNVDVKERLVEYQAKVYHLDLDHAKKVLSMQDTDEAEPAEVEEVFEVVTTAKLMREVVTTAATTIIAAQVPKASALRRRRGVVIEDPQETATASVIVHSEIKSKDKGKGQKEEGSKRKDDSLEQRAAKKQRIDEETEELKTHLQIIANDDDDDVYTEATPLALKMILLVEKKYPLKRFTLEQILNNVRLEVEEESEMSLELLRLVRRQLQEGYIPE
nr:uncharacterized mitochondrial protein AtMg00810-like [Tanacetum cinerariifolium]